MTKTIHFKVTDDLYYKLIELRGKLQADDWEGLMGKLTEQPEQTNNPEQPTQPEVPNPPKIVQPNGCSCATCGHPKESHNADGCWEDGGVCECKEFKHGSCACKGEAEGEKVM